MGVTSCGTSKPAEVEGRIVNLKTGCLSGFWTLQSYVEPRYGLRFLSTYTCDAHLEERHDTFAQPFHKCYSLEGASHELPQDEASSSKKFRLDAPQRDAIESKALGIVRFAHRYHKLDLEGILLEFVVDNSGRLTLHGCWSASICNARDSRRFRSAWPEKQGRVREIPKTFSVPRLEENFEMDFEDAEMRPGPISSSKKTSDAFVPESEPKRRAPPPMLLEFWQGDNFLGEAAFERQGSATARSAELRILKVLPLGHEPPWRSDGRKLLAEATQEATAVVSLRWEPKNRGPQEYGRNIVGTSWIQSMGPKP